MDEAKPIFLRSSGESISLPRYVNLLTASTWRPDMTQKGGERPEAALFWILHSYIMRNN